MGHHQGLYDKMQFPSRTGAALGRGCWDRNAGQVLRGVCHASSNVFFVASQGEEPSGGIFVPVFEELT